LLSQKSEHDRENEGMHESGSLAGLARHENTLRSWWEGQEHAWAQGQEQHGRDDEIGASQHETHGLRDQRVHEEEHEGVEQDSRASSETIVELDTRAICAKNDTWAKQKEERGWDGHFLGRDIWKHVCNMYIL
jgi:hypothetical protein